MTDHAENAVSLQTEIYRRFKVILFKGYIREFYVVEGSGSLRWIIKLHGEDRLDLVYETREAEAFLRGVDAACTNLFLS